MGYRNATRLLWRLGGEVAGFYKSYGPLAQLVVRNAGHMVPHDRPEVAQVGGRRWR
jgi:vitellogenic carboxypeptidase-like protein